MAEKEASRPGMARSERFQKHLFISYAHIDNQPLAADQQGWISRFHMSLGAMLDMRMGRKAEIWRDLKLEGIDVFADEILGQFQHTALLVSVLTPRYVQSEWCLREVRAFCRIAEETGGLVVANKSRVIKVIKTPVEREDPLPAIMQQVLGYEFYTLDEDQAPFELDPLFGPPMAEKYYLKVSKLAWHIAQFIKKLDADASARTGAAASFGSKAVVYLAECSYDRRDDREAVEADLLQHGHMVLPDRQLPREERDYVADVSRLLEQCALSIHMVGSVYGAVPDGPSQKSVVVLQNEAAIQGSRSRALRRVIWLPEGMTSQHGDQQRFIKALHTDPEAQYGADLITGDLETLKSAVHGLLQKAAAPGAGLLQTRGGSGATFVYLVCDERDRKATIPIRKLLTAQNVDVKIPLFSGDAATVRRANQELLSRCDVVMVFYGAGDESWRRTVESDLKKLSAYRTDEAMPTRYTYLAEPRTDDKDELIALEGPHLINGLEGFAEDAMRPLLDALRS